MNKAQEEWINKRCDALDCILSTFFSNGTIPTDEEWETVADVVRLISARAKNNTDVISRLNDITEKWSIKENDKKL